MEQSLFDSLDAGSLVLTAHRRQARQIRYRYAAAKQVHGIEAWESPRVLGWDDWLVLVHDDILWAGYGNPGERKRLLSLFQQRVLWQNIIAKSDAFDLDDVSGTARTAMAAWTMIQAYRLPDPGHLPHPSAEISAFAKWMRRYYARCRDESFMDHARLADSLSPALRAGALPPFARVLLVGFDALTPQQSALLKTIESLGGEVQRYRPPPIENRARFVQFENSDQEYQAVALWVRNILARDAGGNTAVIVPRLTEHRRRVERIFDEVLAPGSSLPGGNAGSSPYNMAVGDTFVHVPLVDAALRLCELVTGMARFETLSSLLRSPFVGDAVAENSLRARFDVWLREQNVGRVTVAKLAGLFAKFNRHKEPQAEASSTESLFQRLASATGSAGGTRSASAWAQSFRELLGGCGWPGDSALDSASFQTAERFRSLLDEMAGLDVVTSPMNADQALDWLRRLANSVRFQPQTPDLSVQVLLPEQAIGLQFDHLWWCGAHAGSLPEPAAPNPFLPGSWQRENDIPGSGADVQLGRGQRMVTSLLGAAGEVVVSAPRVVDEHPVPVSPLLAQLPSVNAAELPLSDVVHFQDTVRDAARLEAFTDVKGPELENEGVTRGGSRLFALQADCPFRAFAELRLSARPLEQPAPGLNARERGSLLHDALEAIWKKIGDLETLVKLHGGEFLETEVSSAADHALNELDRQLPLPLSPRFRALEHQRLARRLLHWLGEEVDRAPFEVQQTEKSSEVEVGGITVRIKVDRVDRLASGGLAVIDYKTGGGSVGEWFGDRPSQPQLPLYALAQTEPVEALAYAFVRPKDGGFQGLAHEAGQLPGIKAWEDHYHGRRNDIDWGALPGYFRDNLAGLAGEFASGHAPVDPKPQACRYCHLASFCRIDAEAELIDESADENGGAVG